MTTAKTTAAACSVLIAQSAVGKPAAIEVKISSDMPLPMPRSVISSPSHMMTPVPAVIDDDHHDDAEDADVGR